MGSVARSVVALIFLFWIGTALVRSADLQISPVSINFKPGITATGITLKNRGDNPIYGQVRAFAWTQKNGEDVLTPTDKLVISPSIVEIAPQAAQTIRLVRQDGGAVAVELSYRLLIDEIPRTETVEDGVAIQLRYSVPVFVQPSGKVAQQLQWRVMRSAKSMSLLVVNSGAAHVQLGATKIVSASGASLSLGNGLLGYILAGEERAWVFPETTVDLSGNLSVSTMLNAQPVSARLDQ